jgi:hypothetical protein
LQTICPTVILPISVSQEARIMGVSHQHRACFFFFLSHHYLVHHSRKQALLILFLYLFDGLLAPWILMRNKKITIQGSWDRGHRRVPRATRLYTVIPN